MPDAPEVGRRWSVYLVRCRHGSLYTGITVDVAHRLEAHRSGDEGAKYLRGRGPLALAAQWVIGDRSLATRVECRIKRMSKPEKEALVARPERIAALLAVLANPVAADAGR